MTDPYKTLGVRRNATAETITRAYRKKAMQHHPDRNPGDDQAKEKFNEVDTAYRLLSDPARRERYDRLGDASEPKPIAHDPALAELCQVLQPILLEILQGIGSSPVKSPKTSDVSAEVDVALCDLIQRAEKHRQAVERGLKTLRDASGRFEVAEGENVLESIVRGQLRHSEAELENVRRDLEKFARVRTYLKGVKYRTDGSPAGTGPADVLAAMLKSGPFTSSRSFRKW